MKSAFRFKSALLPSPSAWDRTWFWILLQLRWPPCSPEGQRRADAVCITLYLCITTVSTTSRRCWWAQLVPPSSVMVAHAMWFLELLNILALSQQLTNLPAAQRCAHSTSELNCKEHKCPSFHQHFSQAGSRAAQNPHTAEQSRVHLQVTWSPSAQLRPRQTQNNPRN